MKKKLLTDKLIRSLKPKESEYMVSGSDGFYIRILPSGIKTFWYRYTLEGKRHKLNLGQYPEISLAEANDRHIQAKMAVRTGDNPSPKSPAQAPDPVFDDSGLTVSALAELWLESWSRLNHTPRVNYNYRKALEACVLKKYGGQLAAEFTRKEAIALLEAKACSTPGQADNILKPLRQMFQYAVDRELIESNPFHINKLTKIIPLMKPHSVERVLSDQEIVFLWSAIEQGGGSDSTRRAMKVMLLTGQRSSEVCGMHSREIQFGIGKPQCMLCRRCGLWTIPAERRLGNKGGEHRVYLTPLAMQIIGDRQGFIFPGVNPSEPLTAGAVNYHVRRKIVSTGKEPFYRLPHWTPHDLRRTCGTGVRRLGASRDSMDLILGHAVLGVTGVYDRYSGDEEKAKWLTAWSDHIQAMLQKKLNNASD